MDDNRAAATLEAAVMQVDVDDWIQWKGEHTDLYGHVPRPDLLNKVYCQHPDHQTAARLMNGVDIALRHEKLDDPDDVPVFEGDSGREV